MKKKCMFLLAMVMLLSTIGLGFAGCSSTKELVIWSFTDEMDTIVAKFKEDRKPDYKITVVKASTISHHNKLTQALRTGVSAPDVFTIEYAFAKNFLESGKLISLSSDGFDLETKAREELYAYTVDFMTDSSSKLRALTWQATPGAFFYRRSTAKTYFGTDDPIEIQKQFSDFDKFKQSTEKLYNDSNGKVKILSSLDDIRRVYLANRTTGWLNNGNELDLEQQVYDYMDMAKYLQGGTTKEKYINGATEQQESWFNDMSNPNVFGYFLPTWGLHYYLKRYAVNGDRDATGDWAVIEGPSTFVDGGTWMAAREGSKMTKEAKEFLEYVMFDEGFLKSWAESTGDFLSNKKIVDEIKDDFSDSFLSGQNHYSFFASIVDNINVNYVSAYDNSLDGMFKEQVVFYARGEKDRKVALTDFIEIVKSNYPQWTYPTIS